MEEHALHRTLNMAMLASVLFLITDTTAQVRKIVILHNTVIWYNILHNTVYKYKSERARYRVCFNILLCEELLAVSVAFNL